MDNKVLYALMTLLFNGFGVPFFMQGKTKNGILKVVLAIIPIVGQVSCLVNGIMGIIMAIKIFQMSDEEYAAADKATLLTGWPIIEE